MNDIHQEKFYEKYAWVIFLLIGVVILSSAIPHALGVNTDPDLVRSISGKTITELKDSAPMIFNLYNFYFCGGGLSDLGLAFFLVVIAVFPFRQGQKWAWYAFWFVPAYFLAWIALSLTLPSTSQLSLILPLIVISFLSIIGLLLPFRKFFPLERT